MNIEKLIYKIKFEQDLDLQGLSDLNKISDYLKSIEIENAKLRILSKLLKGEL